MRSNIYIVRTRSGVTFSIPAISLQEAELRATSPVIGDYLANLMKKAVQDVVKVELHRGPKHTTPNPTFENELFHRYHERN